MLVPPFFLVEHAGQTQEGLQDGKLPRLASLWTKEDPGLVRLHLQEQGPSLV